MGVPKFYRWISERYPLITQRHGVGATEEVSQLNLQRPPPAFIQSPDPLSTCGLPPPVDRLYIDMNGIIHGCSHNNQASSSSSSSSDADSPDENAVVRIKEEDIFRNLSYYLDRIVKEVAKPRELVYVAIDGVGPRAKLNQQRARRYRSAREGEIERSVYDAHTETLARQRKEQEELLAEYDLNNDDDDHGLLNLDTTTSSSSSEGRSTLREVEPGRFVGKFETHIDSGSSRSKGENGSDEGDYNNNTSKNDADADVFHSNFITPGTPFFQRCTTFLEGFLRDRLANDPAWQHLEVIFSGPNTPSEGEHKIMQFLREQKLHPDYDPNVRHCIMGQDGDLIMLGLASHEPNLMLLREQVVFDSKRRRGDDLLSGVNGLDLYLFNPNFEFLHMNILRDYLALEMETSNVVASSPFDVERSVDDFVFLTFFVGNDFLPHMPALDIGDEALDLLFYTYRLARQKWQKEYEADPEHAPPPYLTNAGEIVSGKRLEEFLQYVGRHESNYYKYKGKTTNYNQMRKAESKFGDSVTPSDQILKAKETADRDKYRKLIEDAVQQELTTGFKPVMAKAVDIGPSDDSDDADAEEKKIALRMGNLLHNSIADDKYPVTADYDPSKGSTSLIIDVTDFKGRYYADKFGFSPYDAEKHMALRKAYVEGLVWNLRYYYHSHKNLSWEWFYPYHFGPMISDLVDIETMLAEISFDDRIGTPLRPFEQLLACLPASQAKLLPGPYQKLMTDDDSPIRDFYPDTFTVDMNGKRWPWEAVVLLPFIDSKRLRESVAAVDSTDLPPEDLARNTFSDSLVLKHEASEQGGTAVSVPLQQSRWALSPSKVGEACFRPILHEEAMYPLDGLPTLRDGSIRSMSRRKIRVNIHGNRSRYQTAVLEVANEIPDLVPLESLASFIGTTIYINYPCLIESFVTAVSNSKMYIRGQEPAKLWSPSEAASRDYRVKNIIKSYRNGLGLTGTGGISPPVNTEESGIDTLLYVRPVKGLTTLPDGTVVKTFAKYEIEVPLFVLSWAPIEEDKRLQGIPMQLEKDPYHAVNRLLSDTKARKTGFSHSSSKPLLRAMIPGDDPLEFGMPKSLTARGRRFSSDTKPFGTNRGFSTAARLQATNRLDLKPIVPVGARKIAASPKGRIFTTGLMVLAAMIGFKPVQASLHSPSVSNPPIIDFQRFDDFSSDPVAKQKTPPLDFLHGTTTLSFKYKGGIVAAVDSRASLGSYVGSKTTQKILPINKSMLGTMAGGAADCTFWIRLLAAEAALHEATWEGRRMSVARASRTLANYLYQYRSAGLSIGTMIMGFDSDDEESPPRIYYVDNTGMRLEGEMFAVGSGSTYAQGILDTEWRYDMTDDEAVALGVKAIRHATFRDAGSGGFINVYLIKRKGWIHVFRQDVAALQGID